ncbi:hypothetical protein [Bacillus sp. EB600]|uniref:hypothetical protein n=1 Tax=Bacillus sp. EB600 TaxID=2806345 RepID=UPI00210B2D4D|nr:hypothetical protein [Bacillus sp. EB600]MCQ6282751.1 hypothetical protein [Bacillus sp. EB600]
MKKALPLSLSSMIMAGLGACAMWFSSKPNRIKAGTIFRDWKRKIKPSPFDNSKNFPIKKGGVPHPHDIEDNNMVSEGALYSVKFYNEKMQ